MPSKPWLIPLLLLYGVAAAAPQSSSKTEPASFKLAGSAGFDRSTGEQGAVDVDYTGSAPAADSPYLAAASWKVYWTSGAKDQQVHIAVVSKVDVEAKVQKLRLDLSGDVPPLDTKTWKVLFSAQGAALEMPEIIAGTPLKHAPSQPSPEIAQKNPSAEKKKPFFAAPQAGKPADILFGGGFLAAGGTKPIYALELKGTLKAQQTVAGFHPAVSTDVEINQDKKPPQNTTSFNPDSITAGFALNRVFAVERHPLYGVITNLGAPNFEFSTANPSGAVIFNPAASLVLGSWGPRRYKSVFATLYPYFGLEAGRNIAKPSSIDSIPVNFSNYNAILREVLGADAVYAVASRDRKSSLFSLTGTYRVRIPEFPEPQVRTLHQVTSVTLGTNARHWFEGDINVAPWSFKFLTLTGKYQYGELPPLFQLVDHNFTIGFTLQANQNQK